jgi:lipopolysaccharide export system permease protein
MPRLLFISSTRIGDAVLSTAALEHARALSGATAVRIACGSLAAPLFRAEPGLEAVHVMRKQPLLGHWRTLWQELRSVGPFDFAVDVRGSLITFMLPVKRRAIFRQRPGRHKLDELAAMFPGSPAIAPKVHLDDAARAQAAALVGAERPFLALALGASTLGKMWPVDRFEALAVMLLEGELRGARVVLLGGPDEAALNAPLLGRLSARRIEVIDAAGKLDLLAAAAVMQQAALYVGNDSGPSHLAAAVGAPTLALFGPSDERIYGPRGPRTRAVRGSRSLAEIRRAGGARDDRTRSWMTDLDVETVLAAAQQILSEKDTR